MSDNIVTKLLAFDRSDIERKKGVHKMALSKLGGQVFDFELVALNAEQALTAKDKGMVIDQATGEMSLRRFAGVAATIVAGCPSVFHSNEVRKHYGCNTFEELVNLLLTAEEAAELSDKIDELSDANNLDELALSDDEVKN